MGNFQSNGKKLLSQLIKKKNKQVIENYLPISLLPVCGKILERLLYNKINVRVFHRKWTNLSELIRVQSSGFFLDISKAFDKFWHEGLLFKLKLNGISGNLLNVITDFLYQRKQRVVLNGQHSSWTNVPAGDPRDLFLTHYSFWSLSMTYLMAWHQI